MKRFGKKTIVLFIALSLIFSLCIGTAAASGAGFTDWSALGGFETGNTYYIADAEDLIAFSALVNGGQSGAGSFFELTGDVDLADEDFIPIGTVISINTEGLGYYTLGNPFAGTFDGNGYVIRNLELNDPDGGIALFAYSAGTVKNLTVYGAVAGNYFTAGIVAFGSGTIENVTNNVTVTAEGNCVGGILGEAVSDITIINCHNRAEITNNGVASERSTGRVGGIAGRIEEGYTALIRECSNTADITAYQYVAGIIGGCFGNVTVDACYNSGNITGISFGKVYLGGIAGKLQNGTISNCYNTGNLNDAHWSVGHIRAVGGLVGCEEDHTVGTAISNCYTTGEITFRTDNITPGVYFIYMTGNISGGNIATAENTMTYDNCFYRIGALTIADPTNPGCERWSDLYKNNPLAYDTVYITGCTETELKGADVLAALGSSFMTDTGINDGYPVLYWQTGGETPTVSSGITANVAGGNAVVNVETSAVEGTIVEFSVTDIESGKQIKSVKAIDVSGADLPVSGDSGSYSFMMPGRAVTITVTLENVVDLSAAGHAITLPSQLDAIWNLSVDSTYYDDATQTVKEGADVTIIVSKAEGAVTASFSGITVKSAETDTLQRVGDGS